MYRIKNVELEKAELDPDYGSPDDLISFVIYYEDSAGGFRQSRVPNDPEYPDYQKIRRWYDRQEKKPFKFKFKSPKADK